MGTEPFLAPRAYAHKSGSPSLCRTCFLSALCSTLHFTMLFVTSLPDLPVCPAKPVLAHDGPRGAGLPGPGRTGPCGLRGTGILALSFCLAQPELAHDGPRGAGLPGFGSTGLAKLELAFLCSLSSTRLTCRVRAQSIYDCTGITK